ncbi:unnamed protein product, partial [Ectocarpus sp. 12 AP-2014]
PPPGGAQRQTKQKHASDRESTNERRAVCYAVLRACRAYLLCCIMSWTTNRTRSSSTTRHPVTYIYLLDPESYRTNTRRAVFFACEVSKSKTKRVSRIFLACTSQPTPAPGEKSASQLSVGPKQSNEKKSNNPEK